MLFSFLLLSSGAPIRFSPQIDWESSAGASEALAEVQPIKDLFPSISYADIIALAGQTAVEEAGGKCMWYPCLYSLRSFLS